LKTSRRACLEEEGWTQGQGGAVLEDSDLNLVTMQAYELRELVREQRGQKERSGSSEGRKLTD
jgi:hypothetical protein